MQDLDRILGKRSHVAVLRVLHRAEADLSGREIQRRAGLSNRAAMTALEELDHLRVVLCEAHPSCHRYQVNRRHYLWSKALRMALEAEELFWDDLRKVIRRVLKPAPIAAIVTGPLARDMPGELRDLPLHLLYRTGRERLQSYHGVERLQNRIDERYGLDVKATFMDLRSMEKPEYASLWNRIAREGLLVFGDLPVLQEPD